VGLEAGIRVIPDHLARVVDACGHGVAAGPGQGIVEGGVGAVAIEEAVGVAADVVQADDLATGVDPNCLGSVGAAGRRIVEGGVRTVAVEEAVAPAAGVAVIPDDLTRIVDAHRNGAERAAAAKGWSRVV
jgi:hypothetical protein